MNIPSSFTRTLAVVAATAMLGACVGVPDRIRHVGRSPARAPGRPAQRASGRLARRGLVEALPRPPAGPLIDRALKGDTSLAAARSRVAEAKASARLTAAQVGLRINGNAQVSRQRMSENGLIPTRFLGFTWYTQGDIGIQGSYDFDLWGGHRAAVQAAIGQVRAAEASRSAAALALEVGITRTYFGWLADHARLQLANRLVADQARLVGVMKVRMQAGLDASDGYDQARAGVAAARQMQAALRGSARIRLAVLAALVGVSPDQLPTLQPRALPAADTRLPAQVGLDLIARRPDIAARRWQVEAALKGTQAARAKFFPDVSISALAGFSSIDMGKLLTPGSRVFNLAPAIHLPIFEGGLLRAGYGVSKAQLQAAVAQYNNAVLDAARQVSTHALDLDRLRQQLAQQEQQLEAVAALERNASARHARGITNIEPVLEARARSLQQHDAKLQLSAQILDADVGLIQALGGGYRKPDAPGANAPATPAPATSSARTPTP